MDFFLNPNVAYLLLVSGILLGMLALVNPGTGLLEIGAFFLLVLAGYSAYQLGINPWALVILIVALVPFVYAIRGPRRGLFLGLAILCLVIGSAFLFAGEGWLPAVNPVLALVTSLVAGGFLWLVINKTLQAHYATPRHDLSTLIGQVGEAKTRIHEQGSVQVAGELWSARSEKPIPAGSVVRVLGREGFVLLVEKAEPEKKPAAGKSRK